MLLLHLSLDDIMQRAIKQTNNKRIEQKTKQQTNKETTNQAAK
jgi:hypothetical protein